MFLLSLKIELYTGVQNSLDKIQSRTSIKYYMNFHGEFYHTLIQLTKNTVLQNKIGNPTFYIRKMAQIVYEIECLDVIDPIIAFIIGLSGIVGPFFDPWTVEKYE